MFQPETHYRVGEEGDVIDDIPGLVESGLSNNDLYFENAKKLYVVLRKTNHLEQLSPLVKFGPIWDGDVISKSKRDDLLRWRLAVRCCFKGEQGYTAGSYYGYTVSNADKTILEDAYYDADKGGEQDET